MLILQLLILLLGPGAACLRLVLCLTRGKILVFLQVSTSVLKLFQLLLALLVDQSFHDA
jgi:hypothetical protein